MLWWVHQGKVLLTSRKTRIQARILAVDVFLRLFRCPRLTTVFRLHRLLWHGICRDPWHGLGMVDRNGIHPMCGNGDG